MSKVLNKKELADTLAAKFDLKKKESLEIIDAALDEMFDTLVDGGKVDFAGFGRFEVKSRAAHPGINPATKEPITIAASKSAAFKPAKALKDALNK
ncbi:MAG: HU family DNA-binding protein [Erysipelotrichaceae bacterium]|jgi:DNA-binding protein HU-beta|nr:HU family DNA-binding protein [Erysipelotrichaceae bacterium]